MLLSTKAVAFQVDLFYSMLPHPSSLITKSWARFPAILRDIKRTPASSATTTRGCPVQKPLSATVIGRLRSTKRPVRPTLRISLIHCKIKAGLSGMNAFRRGPLFKSMLNLQLRSFILVIFSYKSSFLRESSFIHRALCCRCTKCRPGPDILTFA